MKASQDCALTLRDRIIIGVMLSCLVISAWMSGHEPKRVEARCADRLGVEWSVEEGATEELEAFMECINNQRGR